MLYRGDLPIYRGSYLIYHNNMGNGIAVRCSALSMLSLLVLEASPSWSCSRKSTQRQRPLLPTRLPHLDLGHWAKAKLQQPPRQWQGATWRGGGAPRPNEAARPRSCVLFQRRTSTWSASPGTSRRYPGCGRPPHRRFRGGVHPSSPGTPLRCGTP